MNTFFSTLSKPFFLILLWFIFGISLWQIVTPTPFLETLLQLSSIELKLDVIALSLFITLGILSLLNSWLSQQFMTDHQRRILSYKQTIKQLKQRNKEDDHQIKTLMNNEQFAYWEWDIKRNHAQFSAQWKRMIGLPAEQPLDNLHDLQKRIHPKDQEAVQKKFFKILSAEDKLFECTHRIQHEDGHYIWVHDKGQVFYADNGDLDKLCAIRLDVSEQKWIEDELEVDATIIEYASEGIAIIDSNMKLMRCNHSLSETLKKMTETIKVTDLTSLLNVLQSSPDLSILKSVDKQGQWRGELSLFDERGELKLVSRVSIQKIFHDTTQTLHYSFIHSDITDLKKTQAALDNLANLDSVTGLANRNRLYEKLDRDLKIEPDITLMFLDLDNFKQVNDTLGHDIGDLLLSEVGSEISKLLPKKSLLARVGGDEFVVYYPQTSETPPPSKLAQSITNKLAQTFQINHHKIQIGSSIGIALYPQHASNRGELMKAADVAMYQAKHAGKGQFCLYTDSSKPL